MANLFKATGLAAMGFLLVSVVYLSRPEAHPGHAPMPQAKIPLILSPELRSGQKIYEQRCLTCHGRNVSGSHKGPSLLAYDRSHHNDGEFVDAIRNGVPQHHWNFGDMPPIDGVSDDEITAVIRYVRKIQNYNESGSDIN